MEVQQLRLPPPRLRHRKASGKPYATFLAERIFTPLGMADTCYDTAATILPFRAYGYAPDKTIINADYVDMTVPFAAGSLSSTSADLLKWELGLFSGKVLKSESLTATSVN